MEEIIELNLKNGGIFLLDATENLEVYDSLNGTTIVLFTPEYGIEKPIVVTESYDTVVRMIKEKKLEQKSLLQFYADTCNEILKNHTDFIIDGIDADDYLFDTCIEILIKMGIVSNSEDPVINATGQSFLLSNGVITDNDIKVFIKK